MEVTKSNFKDVLPQVKKAIDECNFLAIDTELTGLTSDKQEHAFDTMEERYWKLCENSKKFLIIQYGVCCFTYHSDTKKYTHKDFNFYIFPRPHCRQAPDPVFMCQPSSLHYLTSYGFDFNKVINEGISFLKPQDEQKLKNMLKARHEEEKSINASEKNGVPKELRTVHVPNEQKEFINTIHKKIDTFLSDATAKTLELPICSGYQRKLIYQTVEQKALPELDLVTCQNEKNQSFITITKLTAFEKSERLELKQLADVGELDDAIGFRKVLDMISESQKLVIGHNMLLDILHTVHQFYYSLPYSLHEFKDMTKCIFPRLMDTKTLASGPFIRDFIVSSALPNLLEELKNDKYSCPSIEGAEGMDCYDLNTNKLHEAGFDAFVTGFCFIKLASVLGCNSDLFSEKSEGILSLDSKSLSPYVNRPYIMRHYDVRSLNLHGPDPEPNRDHVFFVTFPREWKTIDIVELFLPYGGIYVSWLNDTSALVALKMPEHTLNVKKALLKDVSKKYKVKTYTEYQEKESKFKAPQPPLDGHSMLITDPELPRKRRRNNSDSNEASVTHRAITTIPEEDEAENIATDKQENLVCTSQDMGNSSGKNKASSSETPKAKKQKVTHDCNEVSSTDKLFEEPNSW